MEIILEEYLDYTGRRFLINLESKEVSQTYNNQNQSEELFYRNSAGYGTILTTASWPVRQIFTALYVRERSVELWIDSRTYTVESSLRSIRESAFPFVKSFKLFRQEKMIVDFSYLGYDRDFLRYVSEHIGDPNCLKAFAYCWSASAIGRDRLFKNKGLTREVLEKIQDPFDTSFDVDDS